MTIGRFAGHREKRANCCGRSWSNNEFVIQKRRVSQAIV